MAVFRVLWTLWDIVATIALIGAVALSLGALWVVVKWWDDWRFENKEENDDEQ